jgi:hypothetical protein
MSEYRTPEEDTIGGQHDVVEDEPEGGAPAEPGEKPASEEGESPEP